MWTVLVVVVVSLFAGFMVIADGTLPFKRACKKAIRQVLTWGAGIVVVSLIAGLCASRPDLKVGAVVMDAAKSYQADIDSVRNMKKAP